MAETPWQHLARLGPLELKFTYPPGKGKGINGPMSFNPLPANPPKKILLVNMSPVKKALEKAGVREPVTLQLQTRTPPRALSQMRTFTPTAKKAKMDFPLAKTLAITFIDDSFKQVLRFRLRYDMPLDRPEDCVLLFKDSLGNLRAEVQANVYLPFKYVYPQYEKLERLLAKEQYERGETYCARQKDLVQRECYRILAEAFLEKEDFSKAALYYELIDDKAGFDKLGLVFFERGEISEAVNYFEKGNHSSPRANAYAALADDYRTRVKDPGLAKKYYTKAIAEYEYLVKNYYYVWNKTDSDQRRHCIRERGLLPKSPEESAQEKKLARLLKQADLYCDRLMNHCFHFFCREVITETSKMAWDIRSGRGFRHLYAGTNKFIYQYQLINENNKTQEMRTLLEANGVKREVKDAPLATEHHYKMLIFGPAFFLSKSWQDFYDYKILRNDTFKGEKVVVIEAIPRTNRSYNRLIGNIWVKDGKGSEFDLLKLEWNPKTMFENFDEILKSEEVLGASVSITFFAEFAIKRSGFRLPSRYYIEKAYFNQEKRVARTVTDVVFKRHRYFNVSSEVIKEERKTR